MKKRYDFSAFMQNMNKIVDDVENKEKKEGLGRIINSLQRPFNDVMTSVYQDQANKVEDLYKFLGWKK